MSRARLLHALGGAVLAGGLLAGCGAEDDPATGASPATGTTAAPPSSTTGPPPTVGRPGPPDAALCGVSITDPAPRAGATITAAVASGLPDATFLARIFDAATSTAGSGTTDSAGAGSVQLRVPGPPASGPVRVEISVAGGAEACTTTFTTG